MLRNTGFLEGIPTHVWPVLAKPFTPVSISFQLVVPIVSDEINKTDSRMCSALVVPYDQNKLVEHFKQNTQRIDDVLTTSTRVSTLVRSLGYAHLPVGSTEGVCSVLSSQSFPSLERITGHPLTPVHCSPEDYQAMLQLFYTRQLTEQSESEIEEWYRAAQVILSSRRVSEDDKKAYKQQFESHRERALLGLANQKEYAEQIWNRLVAYFGTYAELKPVRFTGLRSEFFKRG